MISYRNAEHKDVSRIVNLEIEVMAELREQIGETFPIFDEKRNNETSLLSIIEGGCGCAIVALEEEVIDIQKIIGAVIALDGEYTSHQGSNSKSLVIMNLFLTTEHRGRGIGVELVAKMEDYAKENGYDEIIAMTHMPNPVVSHILETRGYPITSETRTKRLVSD